MQPFLINKSLKSLAFLTVHLKLFSDYSALENNDLSKLDEPEKIQFVHAKLFEKLSPLKER